MVKRFLGATKEFIKSMNERHVTAYAAQAAYFIIISFIPFMLVLMTSVKYTPLTKAEVVHALLQVCPENFETFIQSIVNEVYEKSLGVVPVSAVIAMWSAGKGIQALTRGFNSIYQVKETRNFLMSRIRAVFYTLVFVISIILTLTLQVFGNSLQRELSSHFPFMEKIVTMIISMRVVITLSALCVAFLMMYKFIPNRKATFRSQFPGALLCAVCWSAFSFGFSLYIDFYNGAANMYGSMTTIVLVLLWLYFCMMFVMLGAQVNHYFEAKIEEVHQMAAQMIKKEYYQLLQSDEDEEKEDERKS